MPLLVRFINLLFVLLSAGVLLSSCATLSRPPLEYQPGSQVDTLSATASFSISKGDQGMGSNGYLLFQRPDRMRLVVLSPFGTTVMETIMDGDSVTIVNNSKGVAYRGRMIDLPARGEGETWLHARWVMENDPPGMSLRNGGLERINSLGLREQVEFENGLVVSKKLNNGDMVRYDDYELVNGVPLATEIIMNSHDGGRLRIKISEPEVNSPLSPEAFVPRLEGLVLLPLTALQDRD